MVNGKENSAGQPSAKDPLEEKVSRDLALAGNLVAAPAPNFEMLRDPSTPVRDSHSQVVGNPEFPDTLETTLRRSVELNSAMRDHAKQFLQFPQDVSVFQYWIDYRQETINKVLAIVLPLSPRNEELNFDNKDLNRLLNALQSGIHLLLDIKAITPLFELATKPDKTITLDDAAGIAAQLSLAVNNVRKSLPENFSFTLEKTPAAQWQKYLADFKTHAVALLSALISVEQLSALPVKDKETPVTVNKTEALNVLKEAARSWLQITKTDAEASFLYEPSPADADETVVDEPTKSAEINDKDILDFLKVWSPQLDEIERQMDLLEKWAAANTCMTPDEISHLATFWQRHNETTLQVTTATKHRKRGTTGDETTCLQPGDSSYIEDNSVFAFEEEIEIEVLAGRRESMTSAHSKIGNLNEQPQTRSAGNSLPGSAAASPGRSKSLPFAKMVNTCKPSPGASLFAEMISTSNPSPAALTSAKPSPSRVQLARHLDEQPSAIDAICPKETRQKIASFTHYIFTQQIKAYGTLHSSSGGAPISSRSNALLSACSAASQSGTLHNQNGLSVAIIQAYLAYLVKLQRALWPANLPSLAAKTALVKKDYTCALYNDKAAVNEKHIYFSFDERNKTLEYHVVVVLGKSVKDSTVYWDALKLNEIGLNEQDLFTHGLLNLNNIKANLDKILPAIILNGHAPLDFQNQVSEEELPRAIKAILVRWIQYGLDLYKNVSAGKAATISFCDAVSSALLKRSSTSQQVRVVCPTRGSQPTHLDLSHVDLRDCILSLERFSKPPVVNFNHSILTNIEILFPLNQASFHAARLENVQFKDELTEADFNAARLTNMRFRTSLSGSSFAGTVFKDCTIAEKCSTGMIIDENTHFYVDNPGHSVGIVATKLWMQILLENIETENFPSVFSLFVKNCPTSVTQDLIFTILDKIAALPLDNNEKNKKVFLLLSNKKFQELSTKKIMANLLYKVLNLDRAPESTWAYLNLRNNRYYGELVNLFHELALTDNDFSDKKRWQRLQKWIAFSTTVDPTDDLTKKYPDMMDLQYAVGFEDANLRRFHFTRPLAGISFKGAVLQNCTVNLEHAVNGIFDFTTRLVCLTDGHEVADQALICLILTSHLLSTDTLTERLNGVIAMLMGNCPELVEKKLQSWLNSIYLSELSSATKTTRTKEFLQALFIFDRKMVARSAAKLVNPLFFDGDNPQGSATLSPLSPQSAPNSHSLANAFRSLDLKKEDFSSEETFNLFKNNLAIIETRMERSPHAFFSSAEDLKRNMTAHQGLLEETENIEFNLEALPVGKKRSSFFSFGFGKSAE